MQTLSEPTTWRSPSGLGVLLDDTISSPTRPFVADHLGLAYWYMTCGCPRSGPGKGRPVPMVGWARE